MKKRILIIEDDDQIRDVLQEVLSDEGYEVAIAENGLKGLSLIQLGFVPELILLDIYMPVMDGRKFLEMLCQNFPDLYTKVKILVLSAAAKADLPQLFPNLLILNKPIDLDVLLEAVVEVFQSIELTKV